MKRWEAILCCALVSGLGGCSACGKNEALPDLEDAVRDQSHELPVFPGAQGFGATTAAGRGGAILRVTNLATSGEGSLRAALEARGPRQIVFEVAGVIELDEHLLIEEPFVTIAGQTAPPPGITLFGAGLTISTHDVLVQHLHVRPGGLAEGPNFESRDAIEVRGVEDGSRDVHHVVIDHCSLSWGTDETFSTWYKGVHDVTISNSIIAESLDDVGHPQGRHSKGLLIGDHSRRVSVLANLMLHNDDRNPHLKGDVTALVVNNLVYNHLRWPLTIFDNKVLRRGPTLLSAIGNVYIAGADSEPEHNTVLVGKTAQEGTIVYLEDNLAKDSDPQNPCAIFREEKGDDDAQCITTDPPVMVRPLTILPSSEVERHVLANVGAFYWARDPIDTRHIQDVAQRTGRIIDHHDDVGGLPPIAPVTRALELPDDPHGDEDQDGYTNFEAWLRTFEPGD